MGLEPVFNNSPETSQEGIIISVIQLDPVISLKGTTLLLGGNKLIEHESNQSIHNVGVPAFSIRSYSSADRLFCNAWVFVILWCLKIIVVKFIYGNRYDLENVKDIVLMVKYFTTLMYNESTHSPKGVWSFPGNCIYLCLWCWIHRFGFVVTDFKNFFLILPGFCFKKEYYWELLDNYSIAQQI